MRTMMKLGKKTTSAKNRKLGMQLLRLSIKINMKQEHASRKTRPSEANDASFSDFFIFHFLATFSFFHSPRHSFLLVPLFFLVQYCLYHFESVKVHFSAILTKALPTDGRTDGRTDRPTDKASYRDADASKKKLIISNDKSHENKHSDEIPGQMY